MAELDRTSAPESQPLLQRPVSRRVVLRSGLMAGGAAFLAACGAQQPSASAPASSTAPSAPASSAPPASATPEPTPVPEDYTGTTLNNFTGGYMIPWLDAGTAKWKAETGGDALSDNVTFAEKQIKQAGIIATQDPSYDMMYTTAAYGYVPKFAKRLLLPVTPELFGDLSDFPENALAALTPDDGQLRALPLYEFPALWGWNKKLFERIGEDPENPPDNYPDLFKLVPKFKAEGIIPSIQPWLATQAILFAELYWKYIWNSTGMPMFSPDFTQVGFDNDEGKEVFAVIEEGIKSGFWDPAYMNILNEHDAYKIFTDTANVATIRITENAPKVTGEMALSGDAHGVRPHPGYRPGTSGSTAGPDGLGVSKFSQKQEAAWSWAKRTFGPEVALEAATTVKDADGNLVLYPVARKSVMANADVIAVQPLLPIYAEQAKFQTNPWSTPFDTQPVFNQVIAKMINEGMTGAAAHAEAVAGCNDVIIKYLSS